MTYECLKVSDRRMRGLVSDWEQWLRNADQLYCRFLDRVGDSPFDYHEVASVGFLASAAAMGGFIPLAEYEVIKRGRDDKRSRVDGRADFWFCSNDRAYSFEFKKSRSAATVRNLSDSLDSAAGDIACIQREEYHYAAGGLISRISDEQRIEVYREFVENDNVDLAYSIGPSGVGGAFLFFNMAR